MDHTDSWPIDDYGDQPLLKAWRHEGQKNVGEDEVAEDEDGNDGAGEEEDVLRKPEGLTPRSFWERTKAWELGTVCSMGLASAAHSH